MRTRPWTMLLMMLAGWLNRHHQDVIEYLKEENKILREKIGKKRIILNDNTTPCEKVQKPQKWALQDSNL